MSIPNTLTIYINTNIPGSQFIKYSPSMTIPKTNSKIVCFDPLVKLSQKIIDKTPPQYKIIQFFEKHLFKTLISRTEGFQPYRDIQQATEQGLIDDNIEITLYNLFQPNHLFYINQKPYSIFSRDWERGNWKIDTKITEVPTNYKGQYGISSMNYRNIIQTQLKEANNELNALPPDVIEGPNFELEINKSFIKKEPVSVPDNKEQNTSIVPYVIPVPKPVNPNPTPVNPNPVNPTPVNPEQNTTIVPYVNPKPIKPIKPVPAIEQAKQPSIPVPPETNIEPNKNTLVNQTKILRQYFKQSNYQSMINTIYQNMTTVEQAVVKQLLRTYSQTIPKTFSKNIYNETVMGLHIVPNSGQGNCFFIAVADAINNYNNNNLNTKKITYLDYGTNTDKPFSQIVIRTIVANGIMDNPEILQNVLDTAQLNANEMNNEFDEVYNSKSNMDETEYIDTINDIYFNNDNFFINKPSNMDNNNLNSPFKVMTSKQEMIKYLLGDSWADERTIPIIQYQLGLTIIPIQQNGIKYRIPWAYIKKNNEKTALNNWDKYMFVYLYNNHYEEITFDLYINNNKTNIAIFNKNNQNIIPPFYILFLLYGSFYYPLDEIERSNILILSSYLKSINDSFERIIKNINPKNQIFVKNFANYFPSKKANLLLQKFSQKIIKGGANTTTKKHFTYNLEAKSNISYYIVITLDLYPGTSIPASIKPKIACKQCFEKLKKAWADLLGKRYSIQPTYYSNTNTNTNTITNTNTNTNTNTKKNTYNNNNNYTRKSK
jgi:hypothetical protein